jgi:hypothetical protein
MSKSIILVLLLLLNTFAYGVQTGDEWVTINSPEGRFSMSLPHQPKYEEIPNGRVTSNHRYQDIESGYGFLCEYFDADRESENVDSSLNTFRDGVLQGAEAQKLSEKNINIAGYPGRELEMSLDPKSGVVATTRIFIAGKRYYSLTFVRRKDLDPKVVANLADKFFSSFKLLPAKAN